MQQTRVGKFEVDLLAIGKRIGLRFEEINELTVCDLLDMARSYAGEDTEELQEATQQDIDSFFSSR